MAKEEVPLTHDELQAQMDADELQDKLEAAAQGTTKMSVREYAKARSLQPQLVHYYIRTGRITQEPCGECGRKVINIEEADAIFVKKDDTDGR